MYSFPLTIQKNVATASLRRIPLFIYVNNAFGAWAGSVTGIKAQLSFKGAAEAASTNDIVRVAGALHYIELTQAETNTSTGHVNARVAATGGNLEANGGAQIVDYEPHTAGPSAGDNADAVWDEAMTGHVASGSFGQRLQGIRSSTATAGAAGSITLDGSASAVNDFYKNALVLITAGTGANQVRTVSAYVGATKIASVTPNWTTTPDNTSVFVIIPMGSVSGATAPSAGDVADAVWDEARAGHVTAGTFGEGIPVISLPDGVLTAAKFAADSISSNALAASAATEIAAAVFATAFGAAYNNYTFDQLIKLMASVLVGVASGLNTTTANFSNLAGTVVTVSATVDTDGNRTVVIKNP
jgi:hypothetical protein